MFPEAGRLVRGSQSIERTKSSHHSPPLHSDSFLSAALLPAINQTFNHLAELAYSPSPRFLIVLAFPIAAILHIDSSFRHFRSWTLRSPSVFLNSPCDIVSLVPSLSIGERLLYFVRSPCSRLFSVSVFCLCFPPVIDLPFECEALVLLPPLILTLMRTRCLHPLLAPPRLAVAPINE